jgi:DNA-directed RNA polymerase specialized sigma24 family protein
VDDLDRLGGGAEDTAAAVDTRLLRAEEHREVWQAFGRLSAPCQRLLRIVFADPPPRYEEISAALDMPVGSIGPTRARCLASLNAQLNQVSAE